MIPPKHLCQSCHCLVKEDDRFCSNCGQKKVTQTATLKEMLGEFFSNIFSLDSKLIRTFAPLLFIPGKLTTEYLAGKQKLYYTPIRLFLFWMTIGFILLNFVLMIDMNENEDLKRNLEVHLKIQTDSLQEALNEVFPDSLSQQKIDTVFQLIVPNKKKKKRTQNSSEVSLGPNFKVSYDDIFLLNEEEFCKKYEVEGWMEQQFVTQIVKAVKKSDDFQLYLLSHLSWIILFSVPMVALLFKLLYIRQKRPYVEHLVYVLHLHTFIFALFSLFFLWLLINHNYEGDAGVMYVLAVVALYFPISLLRVYQQGKIKTFFKIFLFSIGYCVVLVIALSLFVILNFFLY